MSDTLKKVQKITREILGVKEEEVVPTADLINDLGADSLDLIELVMAVEEDFEFEIPDEEAEKFVTVEDVLNYINAHAPVRTVTATA